MRKLVKYNSIMKSYLDRKKNPRRVNGKSLVQVKVTSSSVCYFVYKIPLNTVLLSEPPCDL